MASITVIATVWSLILSPGSCSLTWLAKCAFPCCKTPSCCAILTNFNCKCWFLAVYSWLLFLQRRFQNDEHIYLAFLKILNEFRKGHKDINKVYYEVNICYGSVWFTALVLEVFLVNVIFSILKGFLFYNFHISILLKGHADLINEFTFFFRKLKLFQQRMLVCELWIHFLALLNFNSKWWFLAI